MLKIFWLIVSFFLVIIIILRVPQESAGLKNFATKSSVFGSPSSAQRFLNVLTGFGVLVYLGIAIRQNLFAN